MTIDPEVLTKYRAYAAWYACGRLDERDSNAFGVFTVSWGFANRYAKACRDTYPIGVSVFDEWNDYAAELQQLVTVELG